MNRENEDTERKNEVPFRHKDALVYDGLMNPEKSAHRQAELEAKLMKIKKGKPSLRSQFWPEKTTTADSESGK